MWSSMLSSTRVRVSRSESVLRITCVGKARLKGRSLVGNPMLGVAQRHLGVGKDHGEGRLKLVGGVCENRRCRSQASRMGTMDRLAMKYPTGAIATRLTR